MHHSTACTIHVEGKFGTSSDAFDQLFCNLLYCESPQDSILLLFSKIDENGEFAKIKLLCAKTFQKLKFAIVWAITNQRAKLNCVCAFILWSNPNEFAYPSR